MKAVVLYAHPNPKSFNAAILEVVKEELGSKGYEVKVKDLYAMNWKPDLDGADFQCLMSGSVSEDVAREQQDIAAADLLVSVFPIWWLSMPALLKGYIDRVFTNGFAYEFTQMGPQGKLTGKKAAVFTTSGADKVSAEHTGMMNAIKTAIVGGTFGLCGFAPLVYHNCFGVIMSTDEQRSAMLEEVRQAVRGL